MSLEGMLQKCSNSSVLMAVEEAIMTYKTQSICTSCVHIYNAKNAVNN